MIELTLVFHVGVGVDRVGVVADRVGVDGCRVDSCVLVLVVLFTLMLGDRE